MSGVILLAAYRPDRTLLKKQLDSIVRQTEPDWQCIVGIDGDGVTRAADVLAIVPDDPRFIVHEFSDNLGHYRNFERLCKAVSTGLNPGVHLTATNWIAFSDQDDYWYPEKLAVLIRALAQPDTTAVQCEARIVTESGAEIGLTHRRKTSLTGLLVNNQFSGSLGLVSPAVLSLALPFPPATDVAYHDHWLGACALALGQIRVLDEVLQDYYQHQRNVIGEERDIGVIARIKRLHRAVELVETPDPDATAGNGYGFLSYLASQRWGWRVNMARALIVRLPNDNPARTELLPFARGRMNQELALALLRAARRSEAPVLRTLSAAIGASVGY